MDPPFVMIETDLQYERSLLILTDHMGTILVIEILEAVSPNILPPKGTLPAQQYITHAKAKRLSCREAL
jgi:hypothetical protein